MQILVSKIGDRLSGVIGTTKYNVEFSKELYEKLQTAEVLAGEADTVEELKQIIDETLPLVQTTLSEIITTTCDSLVFDKSKNSYFLKAKGRVSKHAVPKPLVDWILESVEKGVGYEPIVKAWTRFLRNPNFTTAKAERFAKYLTTTTLDKKEYEKLLEEGLSPEIARERATFRDVSLTRSGLISSYKFAQVKLTKFNKETGETIDRYEKVFDEETGSVTIKLPEYSEEYVLIPPICGESNDPVMIHDGSNQGVVKHRIEVGKIHTLDWNQVSNRDDSMDKGLWVGGLSYIEQYETPSRLLLNIFVDPANIGSFYHGSEFDALKVKEYYVYNAVFAPTKTLYKESTYADYTDKQWEKVREEAIKVSNEKINALKEAQEDLNSL